MRSSAAMRYTLCVLLLLAGMSPGIVAVSSSSVIWMGSSSFVIYGNMMSFLFRGATTAETSTTVVVTSTTESIWPPTPQTQSPCHELPLNPRIADLMYCTPRTYGYKIPPQPSQTTEPVIDLSMATQGQINHMFDKTTTSIGNSFIVKNSNITKLDVVVSIDSRKLSVDILNNDHLLNLKIAITNPQPGGVLMLTVRGNKRVSLEEIKEFNSTVDLKIFKLAYLQEFGECELTASVPSLSSLDGCVYVKGKLLIDHSTDISTSLPSNLPEIRGCIEIVGTKLTDVNFTKQLTTKDCTSSEKHKIINNADLCLHPEFRDNLEYKFKDIDLNGNKKCPGECTAAYVMKSKKPTCEIITDTLQISRKSNNESMEFLENVVEIRGRLVITNNEFEDITFLKKLERVKAKGKGIEAAIEVSYNTKMKKFSLPSLLDIEADDQAINMNGNGEFVMSEEEINELKKKFGAKKVRIINPYPQTNPNGNVTDGTDQTEEGSGKGDKNGGSGISLSGGAIGGIVGGLLGALVIIAAVIASVFILRKLSKEYQTKPLTVYPVKRRLQYHSKKPFYNLAEEEMKRNVEKIQCQKKIQLSKMEKIGCVEQLEIAKKIEETPLKFEGSPESEKSIRTNLDSEPTNAFDIAIINYQREQKEEKEDKLLWAAMLAGNPNGIQPSPIVDDKTQIGDSDVETRTAAGKEEEKKEAKEAEKEDEGAKTKKDGDKEASRNESVQKKTEVEEKKEDKGNEKNEKKTEKMQAIIYHSNRNAVYPFISRFEKEISMKVKVNGKIHEGTCQCKDGLENPNQKPNKSRICGIRWELNVLPRKKEANKDMSVGGWQYIHEMFLEKSMPPVVFEQQFAYTAERMMSTPLETNNDKRAFYSEEQTKIESGIFPVKFLSWKKKPKGMIESDTRIYPEHYFVDHYDYNKEKNKFPQKLSKPYPLHPLRMLSKKYSLEKLVSALMGCPLGEWLDINAETISSLCTMAKEALTDKKSPTGAIVKMKTPVNVRIVGEVRGKFNDLRKCLCLPSDYCTRNDIHPLLHFNHVLLGNYIGGGSFNVEIVALLFAMKALFKDKCVLLRGAMEWEKMNKERSFQRELKARFPKDHERIFKEINDVFNHLPFACRIGEEVMCCHSGIAPGMEDLEKVQLPVTELEGDTLPFNLMFAHPNYTVKRYFDNVDTRVGYYFGEMPFYEMAKKMNFRAMFVAKPLSTGWGCFGYSVPLYSLASAVNLEGRQKGLWAAIAEINESGALTFKVLFQKDEERPKIDPKAEKIKKKSPKAADNATSKIQNSKAADSKMSDGANQKPENGDSKMSKVENVGSKISKVEKVDSKASKVEDPKAASKQEAPVSKAENVSKADSAPGQAGDKK